MVGIAAGLHRHGASACRSACFSRPPGARASCSRRWRINRVLGLIVNATRSTPFIILVVAIIPFTRLVAGTSIGSTAAIVPLVIASTPFIARLVEAAIREVDGGLIETASSFGASPLQIVFKVLIPEALPGLLLALTLAVVSLLGYSAMVGAVGGGGLGDLGIRYGYQRFMPEMMLAVVVVLIALVQLVQSAGDYLRGGSIAGCGTADLDRELKIAGSVTGRVGRLTSGLPRRMALSAGHFLAGRCLSYRRQRVGRAHFRVGQMPLLRRRHCRQSRTAPRRSL